MGRYCDNRKALSSYIIFMTHVGFLSRRFHDLLGVLACCFLRFVSHGPFGISGPSMPYLMSFFPQVSATDEDRGSFGAITYTLGSGSGGVVPTHFIINKETGQLCTSTTLDRDEGLDKFDLTVTATDGVSLYGLIWSVEISSYICNFFILPTNS